MVVLDNGHFFVVAEKENDLFALQKFAVGQMITRGRAAGAQRIFRAWRAALQGRFPLFGRSHANREDELAAVAESGSAVQIQRKASVTRRPDPPMRSRRHRAGCLAVIGSAFVPPQKAAEPPSGPGAALL